MAIKFCVKCGSPLKEGAKFCTKCGWKVPETKEMKSEQIAETEKEMTADEGKTRGVETIKEPFSEETKNVPPEVQMPKEERSQARPMLNQVRAEQTERSSRYAVDHPKNQDVRPSSFSENLNRKTGPSMGNIITIGLSSVVIIIMVILLIMELV